jgi:hypothetical protein
VRRLSIVTFCFAAAVAFSPKQASGDPGFIGPGGSVDEGYFFDASGQRRLFLPAQSAWFSETKVKPNYVRAAIELGIFLGLQTISYWARPAANQFDWDDPEFKNRLNLTAVRFDNNLAFTNFFLHPLSGAGSYWIAERTASSVPIAALYSIVGSIVWEFALEGARRSA